MSWLKSFLLFAFLSYITVTHSETPPDDYVKPEQEGGVYVLNKDNFDDFIKYHSNALVEFYAPWCGHCKALAPEYEKAAKALQDHDPPAVLAKVDATVESELGSRFSISGYPTIKFFKEGKEEDYDGERHKDGIVKFMNERADPNWKPPPDAVITLTSANFQETIDKEPLMLVEFYAPWCGHCKSLAPLYEQAAKELQKHSTPIPLAKVDATIETDIAKKYGVSGYPTLKIFRHGKAYDYKGERNKDEIVGHMIGQIGDGSHERTYLKTLQNSVKRNREDITVTALFGSKDDHNHQVFMDVSNDLRDDYTLFHTYDPEALQHYKVQPGTVIIFNSDRFYSKYEPNWHVLYKPQLTKDEVLEFIEKHKVPLVGHYYPDVTDKRYTARPLCFVFYTVDWSFDHREATQLWRKKIVEIAKDYRDITFAIADEERSSTKFEEFGFGDSGEEINIGLLDANDRKYRLEPMEEYDSDEVREFLDNFKNGKLKPHLKTQLAPAKRTGPFQVLVGSTFDEIVNDKSKDVLVMFHAPWCGHCKNLMPVMNKLAKKLESEKNLVIAKIDSTANDIPSLYKVEGFPTLYYVPSNSKDSPLLYSGARDLDSFVKYLKEHATVTFDKASTPPKEEL